MPLTTYSMQMTTSLKAEPSLTVGPLPRSFFIRRWPSGQWPDRQGGLGRCV
jgi:hypothetical protein